MSPILPINDFSVSLLSLCSNSEQKESKETKGNMPEFTLVLNATS
jgi:hypothetical protein